MSIRIPWKSRVSDESGQGLTEYGIIVSLLAFVAIAVLAEYRDMLLALYEEHVGNIINAILQWL